MTGPKLIMTAFTVIAIAGMLHAQQAPSKSERVPGTTTSDITAKLTGEVVAVKGNWLLAKMEPGGRYSVFEVQPGREFMIDGQKKLIGDLQPGTVLTATVITKTTPVTVRTTSTLNGTVWYASGNHVILTLESGQNKEYQVPESYKFIVEGQPKGVGDLRQGMKVTATKIVEEPQTELSTETVITGRAPKK